MTDTHEKPKVKNEQGEVQMVWELPNGDVCRFVPLSEMMEMYDADVTKQKGHSNTAQSYLYRSGFITAFLLLLMLAHFTVDMLVVLGLTLGVMAFTSRRLLAMPQVEFETDDGKTHTRPSLPVGIVGIVGGFFLFIYPLQYVISIGGADGMLTTLTWIIAGIFIRNLTEYDLHFRKYAKEYCLEHFGYNVYETSKQFEKRMMECGANLRPETEEDFVEHKKEIWAGNLAKTFTDIVFSGINNDRDLRNRRAELARKRAHRNLDS